MKQRVLFLLFITLTIALLVGLNALSYSQKQPPAENEYDPNRSSFNSGATGTEAWFTLLQEMGHKVVRWQDPPKSLGDPKTSPAVFVIVGTLRHEITNAEIDDTLSWVAAGGTLLVADRDPPARLMTSTSHWRLSMNPPATTPMLENADPADAGQMTHGIAAIHPSQPTALVKNVNAVQPSIFAREVGLSRSTGTEEAGEAPKTLTTPVDGDEEAPVLHFAHGSGGLLVDTRYGEGRIIFLGDPYILSNSGISLADNAQLAVNLAGDAGKLVAFDEYHQGFGLNSHHLFQFFAGTPVISMFLQTVILIGFVAYSRSRRFARALPGSNVHRLSKLEYVEAMAELQSRARAYDLALENIYTDFCRRAAKHFGVSGLRATSNELSGPIAERSGSEREAVHQKLFQIEEIIRGQSAKEREVVALVDYIREIEAKLGFSRSRGSFNR